MADKTAGERATNDMAEDEGQSTSEYDQYDDDYGINLSPIDRQYAAQFDVPARIHIIGTGSIGKLVAHSLRGIAKPPPITLIFHRAGLYNDWMNSHQKITIQTGDQEVPRSGFQAELMPEIRRQHGVELKDGQPDLHEFGEGIRPHEAAEAMRQQNETENSQLVEDRPAGEELPTEEAQTPFSRTNRAAISNEPIHNLIICTKAARTLAALSAVRHRLSGKSTIVLMQNGMGTIDEVNAALFPDPETRPNYIQGIITHGVNVPPLKAAQDPFYAVHAGQGTIALGLLPRAGLPTQPAPQTSINNSDNEGPPKPQTELWAPTARYLLRTLTRVPVLCAVGFTPTELLQHQLEKLAVNSVLNPLTALIDARNGAILHNFALSRTLRMLLAETSLVIRSLPELRGLPGVETRFSSERLETLVFSVANSTRDNISSMLADVRAGRQTEALYINGYIVKRGEEMGIKCVVNYAIMQTVIGKAHMTQQEQRDEVPMERVRKDSFRKVGVASGEEVGDGETEV